MNWETLIVLLWLLTTLGAWLWQRPSSAETATLRNVGNLSLMTIFFSGQHAINRHTSRADEQEAIRIRRDRMRLFVAIVAVPLAVFVGMILSRGDLVESQRTVASTTVPIKAEPPSNLDQPDPIVRQYYREPSSGPGAENAEPEPEPLASQRTPTRLFATAKIKPLYNNEQLLGIRIIEVDESSFWESAGFRTGDFVMEVNGELMNTPAASVNFMRAMTSEPEVIAIVRGLDDVVRTIVYRAEKPTE